MRPEGRRIETAGFCCCNACNKFSGRIINISENYIKPFDYSVIWACDVCDGDIWVVYQDKIVCPACRAEATLSDIQRRWSEEEVG